MHEASALTVHYSTTYYITQRGYSTDIYATTMERHPTREIGNDHTINPSIWRESLRGETHARKSTNLPHCNRKNQEQKYKAIWIGRDTTTRQHITLTEEFGKLLT
eukprot:3119289-Amphidinium_carterae.2